MIPLALWQVFYKQIKSQTHCDKVLMESGDEFCSITIIRVCDKDIQQLKKVFRWAAVNPFTLKKVVEEFNTLYPPDPKHLSTDDD